MTLSTEDPLAVAVVAAIHTGDVPTLTRLLASNPGLATEYLGDNDVARSLLHVVTDWPGHFPHGAATVAALVAAGADVNARFRGEHNETPLHWAASSDDVEALDALLDAGANIDADGAVIGGGPPLADARAFAQWQAAHRLVARGATVTLADAAALGLLDRVQTHFPGVSPDELNHAFWSACHGGQLICAQYLLGKGADINWVPFWEHFTPLDAARRSEAPDVVEWLRANGGRSAQPDRQEHEDGDAAAQDHDR